MRNPTVFRRLLSLTLAFILCCSLFSPAVYADGSHRERTASTFAQADGNPQEALPAGQAEDGLHAASDLVRVSIELDEPSAIDQGYSLDRIARNPGAVAYRQSLRDAQAQVQTRIESALGSKLDVKWHMTLAANMISANVRFGDLELIRRVPGVKSVFLENHYEAPVPLTGEAAEPNTANTSTGMVGAAQVWAEGYTGAGSRIAIIDTGLDTTHQSVDADAFDYAIAQTGKEISLFTQADLAAVLTQLNAYTEQTTKPNAAELYRSTKIPFGFNYVDSAKYAQIDHMNAIPKASTAPTLPVSPRLTAISSREIPSWTRPLPFMRWAWRLTPSFLL